MPSRITTCLWFNGQAEEAANFYISLFPNSKITHVQSSPGGGSDAPDQKAASVMMVLFELNGQAFSALNGGPKFQFNEAISFVIQCADQAELDSYWDKLSEGADPTKQQCGWVADRFGVRWQVIPKGLEDWIGGPDREKASRAFQAMLTMKKLDIAALKSAYDG